MPLTKKEIEKIEEEERVRAEAKLKYEKIKEFEERIVKNKNLPAVTSLLAILIFLSLLLGFASNSMPLVLGIILFLLIYFIPSIVGYKKNNAGAILALNLFLGWTLIGWIVALIWATTKD